MASQAMAISDLEIVERWKHRARLKHRLGRPIRVSREDFDRLVDKFDRTANNHLWIFDPLWSQNPTLFGVPVEVIE